MMQEVKFINSITFKLVIAILFLPVVSTLAGFILFQQIEYRRICRFSEANLRHLEQNLTELMVGNLDIFKEMIMRIAADNQIIVPFKLNVGFQLDSYMDILRESNHLDVLALFSIDGRKVNRTDAFHNENMPDSKFADFFAAAKNAENNTFYSDYNSLNPQLYMISLTPVLANNRVIAVLFAAKKIILGDSFQHSLLISHGKIQSASDHSLFIRPFIRETDRYNAFGKIPLRLKEVFIAKIPIPGFISRNYYLIAGVDGHQIFMENRQIIAVSAGVCCGVLFLLIGYSFLLSRGLTSPLTDLVAISSAVSANKKNVKWLKERNDEFGLLSNALKKMTGNLQRTIAELNAANKNTEESNAKLKKYRQNLEQMVDERTVELNNTLKNLQDTQAQLLQAEKMASIGQLAAGVAHEINNPIGFVNSNLHSLSRYKDDIMGLLDLYGDLIKNLNHEKQGRGEIDKIKDYEEEIDLGFIAEDINVLIDDCLGGMTRIKKIVRDLKDFAHPGDQSFRSMDIEAGIESTLNVIANELKYKAEVKKEYGRLYPILAMPQQINQVFMNILVNAVQSMNEPGVITINTSYANGFDIIKISDTGCGIPEENMTKIFDPFFTTKEVGEGTGLGMNITYNIIKKHNGLITIESKPDKGTTFIIKLPVIDTEDKKVIHFSDESGYR